MKLYTLDNKFIVKTNVYPSNFTGIIEFFDGSKNWYVNDKLHRLDGPAIEHPKGSKEWYVNWKLHRIGGPAIENIEGYVAYYIEGIERTKEEHDLLYKMMQLKGCAQ